MEFNRLSQGDLPYKYTKASRGEDAPRAGADSQGHLIFQEELSLAKNRASSCRLTQASSESLLH